MVVIFYIFSFNFFLVIVFKKVVSFEVLKILPAISTKVVHVEDTCK